MNRLLFHFSSASSTQPVIPSSSDVPKSLKCVTAIEIPVAFRTRRLNSILLVPPDSRFALIKAMLQIGP